MSKTVKIIIGFICVAIISAAVIFGLYTAGIIGAGSEDDAKTYGISYELSGVKADESNATNIKEGGSETLTFTKNDSGAELLNLSADGATILYSRDNDEQVLVVISAPTSSVTIIVEAEDDGIDDEDGDQSGDQSGTDDSSSGSGSGTDGEEQGGSPDVDKDDDKDDEDQDVDTDTCNHEYIGSDYIISTTPTYNYVGSVYWECTECEHRYYYVLPYLSIVGDDAWTVSGDSPTCTESAEAIYTISLELYPYDDERALHADITIVVETAALGHDMSDPEVSIIPTLTTKGAAISTCLRCGYTVTYTLPVLSDSAYTVTTDTATCTGTGIVVYSINIDGYEISFSIETDALGHDMGYPEVSVIPTFSDEGAAISTCSRCGYTVTYTLPVLSDSAYTVTGDTATCTESGTATYSIIIDGYEITFIGETKKVAHNYSAYIVTKTPTDTAVGSAYRTCVSCGDIQTVILPDLTNSSYVITDNTATPYEGGTATYTIIINSQNISFTAETEPRSVNGVNPIIVYGTYYNTDVCELFTASSDNAVVINDGESTDLYFYADDSYCFYTVNSVNEESADISYTLSNSNQTLCVKLNNVSGAIKLNLVINTIRTITITGADKLAINISYEGDERDISGQNIITGTYTASLPSASLLEFTFSGNDYYDVHPYSITVTYVMRDGSGSYSYTVYSDTSDTQDGVGVFYYSLSDESYYVTSGNTATLVNCYVGYLDLYFNNADFDIEINVSTKTYYELWSIYQGD